MFKFLGAAACCTLLAVPAFAQTTKVVTTKVIENPCERGPVPEWNMINASKNKFIDFIQEVRPNMPRDMASLIAYEVCDDMSIVGNSDELTKRLRLLIKKYGY